MSSSLPKLNLLQNANWSALSDHNVREKPKVFLVD
jgi:hypothetical protein